MKRISLFHKMILSYALMVIIPLAASLILYSESSKLIEEEISKANTVILNQVKSDVDSGMKEVNELVLKIDLNPKTVTLSHAVELDADKRFTILELVNDFRKYDTLSKMVDDFYVYFHDGDFMVSSLSYYEEEMGYDDYHSADFVDIEQWKTLMESDFEGVYIPEMENGVEEGGNILYLESLPLGTNAMNGKVVIMLNTERLDEMLANIEWLDEQSFYILDQKSTSIVNRTDADMDVLELSRIPRFGHNRIEMLDGVQYIVSSIESDVLDWWYIYMLPKRVFRQKVTYIFWVALLAIGFTVVGGTFIARRFAKRDYRIFEDILDLLHYGSEENNEPEGNVIQMIKSKLNRLTDKVQYQEKIVSDVELIEVIEGKKGLSWHVEDQIKAITHKRISDRIFVIVVEVEESPLVEGTGLGLEETLDLIKFSLRNVLEELSSDQVGYLITEIDSRIIILAVVDEQVTSVDGFSMANIVKEMKHFYETVMMTQFSVGISSIKGSLNDIGEAYQEALEVLAYKLVGGANRLYEYTPGNNEKVNYRYSLDMENKLVNYIKTGDYEMVTHSITEIFMVNTQSKNISLMMVKCLIFDLIGTIIKALDEIGYYGEAVLWQEGDPIQSLVKCETIDELQSRIAFFMKEVCDYVKEQKSIDTWETKIMAYIDSHYMDDGLSVSKAADHFGINRSYLSRVFKAQTGISVIDYITKVRIEHAKRILLEGKTVSDTALETGYVDSQALIRAFKRTEGITPGEYKNTSHN